VFRSHSFGTVLWITLVILVGCGKGKNPTSSDSSNQSSPQLPPPLVPTVVTINPSSATLETIGATVQLTATVRNQQNIVMPGQTLGWTSSNPAVAIVNNQGLVTAVSNGTAQVTVRAGTASAIGTITVASPVPTEVNITFGGYHVISMYLGRVGMNAPLGAIVYDQNEAILYSTTEQHPFISWTSSDTTVATVDQSGMVIMVGHGSANILAHSGDVQGSLPMQCGPSPDRDTLISIYEALDGPNWSRQTNWLSEEEIHTWDGVTTDDGGRVIGLDFGGNGLKGEIPVELAQLEHLVTIYLSDNELSGSIPSELGQLSQLKGLMLQGNPELLGPIPNSFLNLELTALWLSGTQLCVPAYTDFQVWLDDIPEAQGTTICEIVYLPWTGLTVEAGTIIFATDALPEPVELSVCLPLRDFEFSGASITVHEHKWQRRSDIDSPWIDIENTVKTFQVCPYNTSEPGDYRLVGDATIDGERGMYASENFFSIP